MSSLRDARARPGRPRSDSASHSILAATLSLLAEVGYSGLTTDGIADRAGVSKATIYRRWNSKDAVVLAAAESLAAEVPAPDTGSLAGDLEAIVHGLVAVFRKEETRRLIGAMVDQMARKPEFAAAVRGGFLGSRREAARTVLERARDRGEIPETADLHFAVDMLAAPLYYRALVTGAPIDEGLAKTVVAAVMSWLDCGSPPLSAPSGPPGAGNSWPRRCLHRTR